MLDLCNTVGLYNAALLRSIFSTKSTITITITTPILCLYIRYDSVTQQGLLLVEKLDYLQLRAVAAAVRALQDGASLAARRARCQTWLGRKKLARYGLGRKKRASMLCNACCTWFASPNTSTIPSTIPSALRRTLKQSTQRLVPQANQAPAPADVETTKRDLVAQPGGGVPAQRPTSPSSTTPEDAPLGMPPALGQLVELQERLLQRAEVTELQAQLQARIKQGAAEIDQKLEIDQKQISEEVRVCVWWWGVCMVYMYGAYTCISPIPHTACTCRPHVENCAGRIWAVPQTRACGWGLGCLALILWPFAHGMSVETCVDTVRIPQCVHLD